MHVQGGKLASLTEHGTFGFLLSTNGSVLRTFSANSKEIGIESMSDSSQEQTIDGLKSDADVLACIVENGKAYPMLGMNKGKG